MKVKLKTGRVVTTKHRAPIFTTTVADLLKEQGLAFVRAWNKLPTTWTPVTRMNQEGLLTQIQ